MYPFYENTKDDLHCFQACLKMVLKHNFPRESFSFRDLDRISGHVKGKWTWQGQTLSYLAKRGFSVINIENLDYRKFARYGEDYLRKLWPKDAFEIQKSFSDLKREQRIASKIIHDRLIVLKDKETSIDDIRSLYRRGYMVMVSVNARRLVGKPGYTSHLVLIDRIGPTKVFFHDPGRPPRKNASVSIRRFISASTPPYKPDCNVIAVRLGKEPKKNIISHKKGGGSHV